MEILLSSEQNLGQNLLETCRTVYRCVYTVRDLSLAAARWPGACVCKSNVGGDVHLCTVKVI
jgi:hypothetical protein